MGLKLKIVVKDFQQRDLQKVSWMDWSRWEIAAQNYAITQLTQGILGCRAAAGPRFNIQIKFETAAK